jgi:hypothetical protein
MGQSLFWVILNLCWKVEMPGKSKTIKISDRKGDKPWLRKQKPHRYAIQSRLRNNGQGKDFNRAIRTAQDRGFHCAYSNDSFELWFVLHYQYLDQQFHRTQFYQALSRYWGVSYERVGKTLTFTRDIYRRLADDPAASQVSAIGHARRLLALQEGNPCHLQNPVTTVFKLVERLNEHCRK